MTLTCSRPPTCCMYSRMPLAMPAVSENIERSDAEDDAEHGEDAAKFVGPDFLEADEQTEPEIHAGWGGSDIPLSTGSMAVASTILPSRISMRRGVCAAILASWVTSTMVLPCVLSSRKR